MNQWDALHNCVARLCITVCKLPRHVCSAPCQADIVRCHLHGQFVENIRKLCQTNKTLWQKCHEMPNSYGNWIGSWFECIFKTWDPIWSHYTARFLGSQNGWSTPINWMVWPPGVLKTANVVCSMLLDFDWPAKPVSTTHLQTGSKCRNVASIMYPLDKELTHE